MDKTSDAINGNDKEDRDDNEEEEESDEGVDDSDDDDEEEATEEEDNEGIGSDADDDEDTEVDDEEEDESDEDEVEVVATNGTDITAISGAGVSLLTDGSEPLCYICLNLFCGQDIGSPDSCPDLHYFCLDCIEEWSKQINTCPVDRKRFTCIVVRREIGGTVVMKLSIVQNVVPHIESVPEDVTYCEICGRCDREDRLLLCDGCDFGYHCECLTPPIETIPIEEWFCPDCYQRLFGPESNSADALSAAVTRQRRAIARTGASEAVRQRILQRRNGTQRRKRKTKRRTTRRRRKTTKRKTKTTATGGKGTGRKRKTKRRTKKRRKRRTKRSSFASRRLPAADARTRIASKLGLGPAPKSPFGLPSMKNLAFESIRKITDLRAAAGISHLSMFGTELDTYDPRVMLNDDDDLMTGADGTVGVLARSRVNARLLSSPMKQKNQLFNGTATNGLSLANTSTNSSSIDILSEIMSSQTLLHSSARDVRIARDGSLRLNRKNSSPTSSSLPVRNCPNSSHSSPARSPTASSSPTPSASSSPQRTDTANNSNNNTINYNYSFGSAGRTSGSEPNIIVTDYCPLSEDIGSIKPVPIKPLNQSLTSDLDESKVELYSDIESIGGDQNREESSDGEGEEGEASGNKDLVIDDQISGSDEQKSVITSQTSDAIEVQSNETTSSCVKQSTDRSKDNNINKNNDMSCDTTNKSQLKLKSPQKPVNSSANKSKRRHSIKDLFGDSDDEEEDDSDIRRLLAEQGSINVHYPIKMSIVLKNSIAKKETNSENSDKTRVLDNKSVETQPKLDSSIDSGPVVDTNRWIAVNPTTSSDTMDTTITTTTTTNKWKAIKSFDDNLVRSEAIDITVDEQNKWKPIEDKSDVNEEPVSTSIATDEQPIDSTTGVKHLNINDSIGLVVSESDVNTSNAQPIDTTEAIDEGVVGDEEEGEIREEDQKVRRCKHGRILRDKHKDVSKERAKSRHRSRSSESKVKHKDKDTTAVVEESGNEISSNENVLNDSLQNELNVEFKEKQLPFEPKETLTTATTSESMDTENSERIGWKKLSTTTKTRVYRDGKPKDEELLFREREVQKKLIKKALLTTKATKQTKPDTKQSSKPKDSGDRQSRNKESNSRRIADDMSSALTGGEELGSKHSRKHRLEDKTVDENSGRRHKRKSEDLIPSNRCKRSKRREESTRSGSSARAGAGRSGDEYSVGADSRQQEKDRHKRHHKSGRHKHSSSNKETERLVSGGSGVGDRRHRDHRSSKHTHHSSAGKSKTSGGDSDVMSHMMSSSAGTAGPTKILREHSSYADITPLDSKEIYAEGDRIVITVRRENSKKPLDSTTTTEPIDKQLIDESLEKRKPPSITSSTESSKTRVSSKKDDSIYWASPPPPQSSTTTSSTSSIQTLTTNSTQSSQLQTTPSTTTTTTRTEEDFNITQSTGRGLGADRKSIEKSEQLLIDSKKDPKLLDELRFLPRSLHQSDVRHQHSEAEAPVPTLGPHTPEGDYNEDQFMPTPTQDESQSSLRTNSMSSSSRSSPLSGRSSPGMSNGGKDEVYDPEAPLQSPVDHQSGASSGQQQTSSGSPHKKSNSSRSFRTEPKSPPEVNRDVSRRELLSKRSPPLSRRQTSVSEHQNKYSPKDIPKSSPSVVNTSSSSITSSATHSTSRSPFKSPSVLSTQRQQMKPSPQKPVQQQQQHQQKSSASSLMPPPMIPTSRGQSTTGGQTSSAASFAVTAAAIASINPQNLAQLLQMAQTLNAKSASAVKQAQQHRLAQQRHGSSSSTALNSNSVNNNSQNYSQNSSTNRDHNRDHTEVVDMDVESPSPPPLQTQTSSQQSRVSSTTSQQQSVTTTTATVKTLWDQIIKSTQQQQKPLTHMLAQKRLSSNSGASSGREAKKGRTDHSGQSSATNSSLAKDRHQHHRHQVISVADNKKQLTTSSGNKLDQLTVLDDVPSSAVEMAVKEKFIKKLNRQERVIEEVKLVLKPHYQKRIVTKEEYKEILRKSVPKICHSRSGEINPMKIKSLIDGYIKRFKYLKKKSKKVSKN